jgi:hypothetical protein
MAIGGGNLVFGSKPVVAVNRYFTAALMRILGGNQNGPICGTGSIYR